MISERTMKIKKLAVFIMILTIAVAVSCSGKVDKKNMATEVKAEFLHAWNGYKTYAWGHDALKPLSKTYHDWYGESFCMTPVDAFDAMILMGLNDEAHEVKNLILETLSFDKDVFVQNFEVTIRLLGGLLSAYQMDGDPGFLKLAEDLGKKLLPVFNSKTGMPYRYVNLKTGETKGEVSNPAEIGTLFLEFGMLSRLTGNSVYYEKSKKAITELYKRRSKIDLMGTTINVDTGEWINRESHISGMIDSYYEYLVKGWLLFGDEDCKNMWDTCIKAVQKYLAETRGGNLWYGHADMETGKIIKTYFGALDAFFPAVLALSGDVDCARRLHASCFRMWSDFDVEPEQIDYGSMEIIHGGYVLRPENIESAYYLYHYTGDEIYLFMGRTYMESLLTYCKTDEAYAALKSVTTKEKDDSMESFFLAETLKYLYLLFAPEDTLDFEKVIFNTEAHPFRKSS